MAAAAASANSSFFFFLPDGNAVREMKGWGEDCRLHPHAAKWRREADGGFNGQTECASPRGFKDATRSPLMAFCSRACQTWIRLQNTVFQPPRRCQVSEFKHLKWTAVLFPSLLEAPIDGL